MTQSRPWWRAIETIHVPVYFAPGTKERYEEIGLKGYWMGYTASRSAPLGTPAAPVVTALFHGFAPKIIERALPSAWERASRDDILAARYDLARSAIAAALEGFDVPAVARELSLVNEGLDFAGKALAAAHYCVPVPEDPVSALWHHASVLREYRGDCHIAVLTAVGLNGVAANVLAAAAGLVGADQRTMRGWSEDEWAAGTNHLISRGWLDADGTITPTGQSARDEIEDTTDLACASGISRDAAEHADAVEQPLREMAQAIVSAGGVAFPNPAGATRP